MRKEFRKILKSQFSKAIDSRAGFSEMKFRSSYVDPRDIVFVKILKEDQIHLFVILVVDSMREAFTLEVGWCTKARFPELSPRPSGSPTANRAEFEQLEFVCRVGDLFNNPEYRWSIQPDLDPLADDYLALLKDKVTPIPLKTALSLVSPLVDDALNKLVTFAIPYLNEFLVDFRSKNSAGNKLSSGT